MLYTTVEAKSLPFESMVVVFVLYDDVFHSQSMNRRFFPAADHMHGSLYLHLPPICKRNNIGWMVLTLSSACSYILHASAHRLDICDTMVCYHNSVGLAPQIADNFRSQGKYL